MAQMQEVLCIGAAKQQRCTAVGTAGRATPCRTEGRTALLTTKRFGFSAISILWLRLRGLLNGTTNAGLNPLTRVASMRRLGVTLGCISAKDATIYTKHSETPAAPMDAAEKAHPLCFFLMIVRRQHC